MEELAQVILVLLLLAVALAFARGGWPAVAGWFRAKIVGGA